MEFKEVNSPFLQKNQGEEALLPSSQPSSLEAEPRNTVCFSAASFLLPSQERTF